MAFRRILGIALLTLLALDIGLRVLERRVLIGTRTTLGWVVEGDLLYPQWDPSLTQYAWKERKRFTHCIYWNGLGVTTVALPSEMMPDGCPIGLFAPRG